MKSLFISTLLFGALAANAQTVKIKNAKPEALYRCGENAEFSADVQGGDSCTVMISNDNGKLLNQYAYALTNGNPFKISAGTMDAPGFLRVTVRSGNANDTAAAAFEPEKIKAGLAEPEDFDAFWADCVRRQKQIKDPVRLTPIPQFDTGKMKAFKVEVSTLDGEKIYGYLSVPKKDGKFPVVAYVPGASILINEPNTNWPARNVMYLIMNVHRIDPSNDPAVYGKQKKSIIPLRYAGLPDREKYYYRNAILAVSEAIDAMARHPGWDGKHLVFKGASQGGAFALFMGGLNRNLTATISEVSALCDHGGYLAGGRAPGWPLLYQQTGKNNALKLDEVMKMAGYFDGVNFAKRIRVPLLMTVGFKDTVCSPSSVYAAYNAAVTGKEIINDVDVGHGISSGCAKREKLWLDPKLGQN